MGGLPEGLVVFVKASCPTCQTVVPALERLRAAGARMTVYSQDDPDFPAGLGAEDDSQLRISYENSIEIVPTLLRVGEGAVRDRAEGWSRPTWERISGLEHLGYGLPEHRPGCGSRTLDPGMPEMLAARFGAARLASRRVELGEQEDPVEAAFDRGWSDGLPVVPPTVERVLRMLGGVDRDPREVVAVVPPDLVECSVEKAAVNAVMAGCRPEYLPVVLAALEAACTDDFNMHGLLATTWAAAPVVVVNGPVAERIGMNWGGNVLGQGNRANATIGRALQLIVRNVGGGRPGGVDRAAHGNPGKFTFCFAEDERGSPWEPLSVERGMPPGRSAVTLFGGSGVQPIADQISRTPESLSRSLAACLRTVAHPKLMMAWDAMLVVGPDHARVFREAGWSKARLRQELEELLTVPGSEVLRGAAGISEGMPERFAGAELPKFRPGGLLIVHAGGAAGLFSAIIGGWVGGAGGSEPVTREVER
ncbi:MAG: thioredoxin [Candidatus Nephthysia bennettiae]|uniref:Thioredoxin n=1 Tax=Candidatus Nephthysia bennettiae TaxID=3127016 RepID=A0A934K655_9BACT|nr:thioredoxin [Candidatus Dormibacteraeota bacterium]MBJ7611691.1 thioredoxin [Candidatus Dormibacteraeota bacterium]PZR88588.1 MAG: thioredoxin [Candidatus Dormibacteraeota bacterium]